MTEDVEARGYRILRRLGTGGMGAVFVGEKLTTRQQYAIKFLREDFARDASYLARFEREINALVSIRHPHVVNVFDWWFPPSGHGGKPFIVMELLDGEGLDERLHGHRSVPAPEAINMMLQVLDGLGAAHGIAVVHRDLGPSNVFLCRGTAGRRLVKILDFGLARPSMPGDETGAGITGAGTLMGKPGYVAPEMLLDAAVDERSDIFACGMLLYRMLAGRLPFITTQTQALWIERFSEVRAGREIPPLRLLAPGVEPELEAIVARAVRLRPAERYQKVEDMQVDLLAVAPSAPEPPAPVPAGQVPTGGGPTPHAVLGERWLEPPAGDALIEDAAIELAIDPAQLAAEASNRAPSVLTSSVSRPGAISVLRTQGRARGRKPFPIVRIAVVAIVLVVAGAAAFQLLFAGRKDASRTANTPPVAAMPDAAGAIPPSLPDAGPDAEEDAPSASDADALDLVVLTVTGVPRGAQVTVDRYPLPKRQHAVRVPRSDKPLEVLVEADGYAEFRTEIVPSQDVEVPVRMRRAGPGGRSGP